MNRSFLIALLMLLPLTGYSKDEKTAYVHWDPSTANRNGYVIDVKISYGFANCYGQKSMAIGWGEITSSQYVYKGNKYSAAEVNGKLTFDSIRIGFTTLSADLYEGSHILGLLNFKYLTNFIEAGCFSDISHFTEMLGINDKDFADSRFPSLTLQNFRNIEIASDDKKVEHILSKKVNDEEYRQLILRADYFFAAQNYDGAKAEYKKALSKNVNNEYCNKKIDESTEKFKQKEQNALLNNYITKGNDALSQKKYSEAKSFFQQALSLSPNNQSVIAKIAEIDKAMEQLNVEIAKNAEAKRKEEAKQKELEAKAKQQPKDDFWDKPENTMTIKQQQLIEDKKRQEKQKQEELARQEQLRKDELARQQRLKEEAQQNAIAKENAMRNPITYNNIYSGDSITIPDIKLIKYINPYFKNAVITVSSFNNETNEVTTLTGEGVFNRTLPLNKGWNNINVTLTVNTTPIVKEIVKVYYKKAPKDSRFGTFTDPRDGNVYKTVKIGNQVWMAENFRYKTSSGCWAYKDDASNVNIYGYLYDWDSAMSVCPAGWHIPSIEEFGILIETLGGDKVAGNAIKSTTGWQPKENITNSSGFNALPSGYRTYNGLFFEINYSTGWWTSYIYPDSDMNKSVCTTSASSSGMYRYNPDKAAGYSVRCIRD